MACCRANAKCVEIFLCPKVLIACDWSGISSHHLIDFRPATLLIFTSQLLGKYSFSLIMVLQDLGRRINGALSDLTRSNNLDEKVSETIH